MGEGNIEVGEHLDATSEVALDVVKKRAVKGIATLTGRNIFIQAIGFASTFLLTIFLSPGQFGIFFIVSAVVNFFGYFSDIGLGAALIQKKDRLDRKELETTFTVQNTLVVLLILIIFIATPFLQKWQNLNQESIYLLWALSFSLLLSSLKSIPSLLLERELDFNKYVIPQIAEQILYYIVAVVLAWQGFGITSFTIAVMVRGVVGLTLIYIIRPFKPGFSFSLDALKGLLRFGLPYQANTFLALAKDDLMTVVLGGIIGPINIGFLGWAQKWATQSLRLVMDPVTKVTFPAFSRMQGNQEELSKAVTKSIFFICLLVFPTLVTLVIISPILINLIPKYIKWEPALMALGLVSINSAWAAVATPLTNVLNAIGKIKTTFRLMIMWTVLTWVFLPALAYLYGVNGAAFGYALVGSTSIVAILVAVKSIKVNLWESVGKPLVGAALVALALLMSRYFLQASWLNVAIMLFAALFVYSVSIFILTGPGILKDFKRISLDMIGRS